MWFVKAANVFTTIKMHSNCEGERENDMVVIKMESKRLKNRASGRVQQVEGESTMGERK